MTDRDDSSKGFLERWSRKKIDAERDAPEGPPASGETDESSARETALPEHRPEADAESRNAPAANAEFDLASLPSLDSITAATDIRAFLMPGVPKELARAALRRAWSADPAIRDFVGLAENAWDFTDPDAMPGFGALPAGYDVKKMVARIFGESELPVDANVAATQPPRPEVAHMSPETAAPAGSVEAALPAEGQEPFESTTIANNERTVAQVDFVRRDNDIALHKSSSGGDSEELKYRRQHGGALPE